MFQAYSICRCGTTFRQEFTVTAGTVACSRPCLRCDGYTVTMTTQTLWNREEADKMEREIRLWREKNRLASIEAARAFRPRIPAPRLMPPPFLPRRPIRGAVPARQSFYQGAF